jgi:hypothetical protein
MSSTIRLPATLFPQIFRKDLRLLWPLALTSAGFQTLLGLFLYRPAPYSMSDERSAVAALLTLGLLIAMVLLIVLTVQQDAIPGVTQDWLVRPIRRRDLLLAKLVSVVVLIHVPIMVTNLLQGLAEGFPFGSLLRAVLLSNFEIALVFSLPVTAVAALTRSVGEALLWGLGLFFGLILARLLMLGILYPFTHTFHFFGSTDEGGVQWVWRTVSHAELLAVTIAVLILQFYRRSTARARALFAGGLLLFMLISDLPVRPAFAVQQWLAPLPGAGAPVAIAFAPGAGAADQRPPGNRLLTADSNASNSETADKSNVRVLVPLRLSGLVSGRILHTDFVSVRLVRDDGSTLYRGPGEAFDWRSAGASGADPWVQQAIRLPASVYAQASEQPLQLELEYSLTLFRSNTLAPLAAAGGRRDLPGLGHCASRLDPTEHAVEVACRSVGEQPTCFSLVLEQPGGNLRNPEKFVCELDYQPAALRFSSEPTDHFDKKLPYQDSTGATHFPVGAAQLDGAQVLLSVYEPEDHFTRRLIVPQLRLSQWRATP